ncbi:MAG: hypothetical protein QW117_02860 [Candidatus Pacearchaeota archaeon]
MKNLIFVITMAFVLALSLTTFVKADNLDVTINDIVINGLTIQPNDNVVYAGFAGSTLPVTVHFTSNVDVSDARIKVWIGGEDEIKSRKIRIVNGSTYSETLYIKIPSDIEPEEEYKLYVSIETQSGYVEEQFNLKLQRESYDIKILDVDIEKTVEAGSLLPINIVIKNTGYEELEDLFVIVTSEELGIEKKVYLYDLQSTDCLEDCEDYEQDSIQKTINIKIPDKAKQGIYKITIEVKNKEVTKKITKEIFVYGGRETLSFFVPIKSKEITINEIANYDLIIVNAAKKIAILQLETKKDENLEVDSEESVIVIPPETSKTIKFNVKAKEEGKYSFVVNIKENENVIKSVEFNANAIKGKRSIDNITMLTIILAIIFVILLIVLIVLLTKKPLIKENLEESYY